MKLIFALFFMFTAGIALYADEVVLSASADETPKWVTGMKDWTMVTNKKTVSVFFKASGTGESLDKAKMIAEGEAIAKLAKHIKSIVHYEFVISPGFIDDEFEPFISSTVLSISKNIDTSGKKKEGMYWEFVQDAQSKQKYYVCYMLYSIDYKTLKKSMIDAWTKELDSMDPEIKKMAKEILKKLKSEK